MIDGLLVNKITNNLNDKLLSGKIQKIYQINDNEILLKIRAKQTNYQLFNSIQSNSFRLHISNQHYTTLEVATNFTMVLRKQLEGGIIKNIFQHECERTIIFEIVKLNELRDEQTRYLIFELLGRHSNTILCDQDYTIIQTLKFVPLTYGLTRIIQRGAKYEFIDSKDKINPLTSISKVSDYTATYQGFSKLLSDEFNYRSTNAQDTLNAYLTSQTVYVYPKIISYLELTHLNEKTQEYSDLDLAFDSIYATKSDGESITNIFKNELKNIRSNIKKNNNKITKLQAQYQANLDYQIYQKYGTLLYDNIYQFNKEQHYENVKVFDYETNEEITIILDKQINYQKNAQAFLKKYHKLKTSFSYLEQQITLAKDQNEIYEDALTNFEYAKVNDVKEILDSLKERRLLKGHSSQKKKNYKPKYEVFISSDDQTIYVGKNSIQNDYLSFTLANKNDTWLHIKDRPGAHVIIKSEAPTKTTLEQAAKLAVFYSKTQPNTSYEVAYTLVKNLRKIKGSKLGQITYKTNESIIVINDIEITNKLKRGN